MKLLNLLVVMRAVSFGDWCGARPRNHYGTLYSWEHASQVESCQDCDKDLCVKSKLYSRVDQVCYWSEDKSICQSGRELKVDCGWDKLALDCSECGLCEGECHWIPGADICVHSSEYGPRYRLSHTSRHSHLLLGYSRLDLNKKFYLFLYFNRREEFVSRLQFSREDTDLVLYRNKSKWFLMCGGEKFIEDPTIRLVAMDTTEDHDCEFGEWEVGPCSLSCGGGVRVKRREVLQERRGHGRACTGQLEVRVVCNSQPCDEDCQWSDWQEETVCSQECGGGLQNLSRIIVRNNTGQGLSCSGKKKKLVECNQFLCPEEVTVLAVLLTTLILILSVGLVCYLICCRPKSTNVTSL